MDAVLTDAPMNDTIDDLGMTFQPEAAVAYSLVYNASYMVPNMIVAIIAICLLKAAIEHLELKRQYE